jgi:hypothetical protein
MTSRVNPTYSEVAVILVHYRLSNGNSISEGIHCIKGLLALDPSVDII